MPVTKHIQEIIFKENEIKVRVNKGFNSIDLNIYTKDEDIILWEISKQDLDSLINCLVEAKKWVEEPKKD